MPKFNLRFERYLQSQCVISVEADALDEAIAQAGALDPGAFKWGRPDPDCATGARLHSVEQNGATLARVGSAEDFGQSWTNACLIDQWSRALEASMSKEELRAFAAAAAAHYAQLVPELEDGVWEELTAPRLRTATAEVCEEAAPAARL